MKKETYTEKEHYEALRLQRKYLREEHSIIIDYILGKNFPWDKDIDYETIYKEIQEFADYLRSYPLID